MAVESCSVCNSPIKISYYLAVVLSVFEYVLPTFVFLLLLCIMLRVSIIVMKESCSFLKLYCVSFFIFVGVLIAVEHFCYQVSKDDFICKRF